MRCGWLWVLLTIWTGSLSEARAETHHAAATAAELWGTRDQAGVVERAIETLETARTDTPEDFDIRIQLARFYYWKAEGGDRAAKVTDGRRGWDEAEAAKRIRPGAVEGYYWAAACVGAYSQGVGISRSIVQGLADHFETNIKRAIDIDATHDNGGPARAFSRFYTTIPRPFRNLDKARTHLDNALHTAPDSAINLYFLADLEQLSNDESAARTALRRVLDLDPNDGDAPGIRRVQARARALLVSLD